MGDDLDEIEAAWDRAREAAIPDGGAESDVWFCDLERHDRARDERLEREV